MKVLITGASSGIGRDMARILAKLNYNLILVARNEDGLTKIKNELETENNKINITIYPMDLNIKENCYKLYENEKNIDVLINNAGFGLFGEFAETDLEKEITMINTNIKLSGIPSIAFLLAINVTTPIKTLKQINFIPVLTGFKEKSFSKNINTAVIVVTPINVFSEPNIILNPTINPIINTNINVFPIIFLPM